MPLLPYEPTAAVGLCEELDRWRDALDHRGPTPRRWAGRIRRELEAEAIAASTSMEGVRVTAEEVRRILAGHAPPQVRPEDRDLVEGYREAMSFVLRRADDPSFGWTRELVVGLHDRILAGRHDEGAGRLRSDKPAFVVNSQTGQQLFLPPAGEDVADLVDDACLLMDGSDAHPAIAAAWIHIAIAAIHPFHDGNGRSARVLASLAMYRGGFKRPEFTSLEEWWGRHLADYYAAFSCLGRIFDPRTNVTRFLVAHITAQLHQIRAIDLRERVERQIWDTLEVLSDDAAFNPRTVNATWDAFFGRDVTAGYYRGLADVSAATATNDLAMLVAADLLRAKGNRRGRRYLGSDRLFEQVGRLLKIDVAGPPEVARDRIVSELTRRVRSENGRSERLR